MRPARTIMSAYYRRRGEDRVTEVLATVLDQSPELLLRVVGCVDLPSANTHDIQTQVRSGGVTIDLEVVGRAADGSTAWVLWSEHKVDDQLTATQLEAEWSALRARAGSAPSQLVAITRVAPTPSAQAFAAMQGCALLRWSKVTALARAALDSAISREPDHRPATLADQSLAEWIEFANNELEAPVEALTPERVRLLPEADKALETVGELLDSGFNRACADLGASTPRERDDELHANPPEDSWLAEHRFKLYAKYEPDGFGDVDGACLVVGAWIEGEDAVSARRNRAFHTALSARGLAIWDEDDRRGGWIEFGEAVSLAELAAHPTLGLQIDAFDQACLRVLRQLAAPL